MILALIILGIMSCENQDEEIIPVNVKSNKAIITFGNLQVGDSIFIYTDNVDVGGKINRAVDIRYFPCNMYNNPVYPIRYSDGCEDNSFIVSADTDLSFKYKGDITIEYLFD